ncbi:dihydrolipoamide acetyltransferase family protein [Phaeobacter sp. PT47_59]|uniref:dihydrolipoamide acetyltransferase family protein n=1 Tax=Phaeobacter sp. PT47_59 TaxID=3029979 RepID=UPI00238054BE|nr:dihydrolipoamide acetyltransferase family protein [Phaeobacter sp. PT47_59]MDE4173730.1 dihydrolipoamide acetyltransferase family protein [Phaeobacter sp. PT47_59]
MSAFLMPSLGADMEAGTLMEQVIAPGQPVARGDIIAVVETQKGAIEIECYATGTVTEWLVAIGERVPVGTPLARIDTGEEEAEQAAPPQPEPMPQVVEQAPEPAPVPRPVSGGTRVAASPAARRLAAEKGVELGTIPVTSGQPIRHGDVAAHLKAGDRPESQTGLSAMRQAISASMSRSKREIPHFYLTHQVDLTALTEFIAEENAGRAPEERLLPPVFYLRAMARALKKYPEFNGHFEKDIFTPAEAAHIGLAIALRGGGLVAPALFDVAGQEHDTLMVQMRDLIARVRAGRFKARELSDATITLTSLGDRGIDGLFGVIYPPQVAIVGIGTPALRPWVVDGTVMPRQIATLTLAADHRVSDGHRGALFLRAIDRFLQEPETL